MNPYGRPPSGPEAGKSAARVAACIKEHGHMCFEDIAEETGIKPNTVRAALTYYRGRLFRIAGWRRMPGRYGTHRAVWGLGTKEDAPKPARLTRIEIDRRYRERQRVMVNSVFALSIPVERRRVV